MMDEFWQELLRRADAYSGRVLAVVVILVVGVLVLRFLVGPLRRLLEQSRLTPAVASFLANSARGLLLVVIVLGVLQQLGVETASLLTVLAAAALAVALSLQGALANFTAGLLLLAFRMVRVGDLIEVGAMRGRVSEIFPFHVVLVTEDNQEVVVPNATLTGTGFRNYTALPVRRVQWSLPLKVQDDLAAAKEALLARLRADARVLGEPPPRVFVQEWGDDKRVLAVQASTASADHQAVQEELLEALGRALEALRRPAGERTAQPPA
jgi:small conductance mechanosensitive channel